MNLSFLLIFTLLAFPNTNARNINILKNLKNNIGKFQSEIDMSMNENEYKQLKNKLSLKEDLQDLSDEEKELLLKLILLKNERTHEKSKIDFFKVIENYIDATNDDEHLNLAHEQSSDSLSKKKRSFNIRIYYDIIRMKDGTVLLIPKDVNKNHYFIG